MARIKVNDGYIFSQHIVGYEIESRYRTVTEYFSGEQTSYHDWQVNIYLTGGQKKVIWLGKGELAEKAAIKWVEDNLENNI